MYKLISENDFRSCIALKDIPKDTIIFKEQINFIIDKQQENWYEELLLYELENNYEKFLDLVPLKHDKYIIDDGIFTKMSDYKKIKRNITKQELDLYYNKIIRNAFNVNISDRNYATILYRGRQFNHSCDPNVKFRFVSENNNIYSHARNKPLFVTCMYMIFYASKNIKKGEELLDNYFDINLPYQKRQHISQKYYGFSCQCKKCIVEKQ
jgi:hypothetical protein